MGTSAAAEKWQVAKLPAKRAVATTIPQKIYNKVQSCALSRPCISSFTCEMHHTAKAKKSTSRSIFAFFIREQPPILDTFPCFPRHVSYQLVISSRLSTRILTNQPTVGKTNCLVSQQLISESLWMIVDEIRTLTHVVRVRLASQSSHSQRQCTFQIMCVPIPTLSGCVTFCVGLLFVFFLKFFF